MKFVFVMACLLAGLAAAQSPVQIGSKNFTESYILAEILAQGLERAGVKVDRRLGMGGSGITWEALLSSQIDVYPEYTGTLSLSLLGQKKNLSLAQLRPLLEKRGIVVSEPLGFNNSYAFAVTRDLSRKLGLKRISQLKDLPQLRMAFSHEFMERADGYAALVRHYGLKPESVVRMDHSLVYSALEENKVDVIEVYTTDGKIEKNDLVVLEDDRSFFPAYEGIFLVRSEALLRRPELSAVLNSLAGTISNQQMRKLNAQVEEAGLSFYEAVAIYFDENAVRAAPSLWKKLLGPTKRHLLLVFLPLLLATLIGIPLGVAAVRFPRFGQAVLLGSGLIQTIPALALLCFLIPLLGIGLIPSVVALVLYALLPIVRGTHSGLVSIDPKYREVCRVLGLSGWQKLAHIECPLASVHITAGLKTAAVMTVGMATLAAFIGAGGYGALIVTGLALNNHAIILQGALPAALLAVIIHYLFELLDRFLIPKGLRIKQ